MDYNEIDSKQTSKSMTQAWNQWSGQLSQQVDRWLTNFLHTEKVQIGKKAKASGLARTKLITPEAEVKRLITQAASLADVWEFFLSRLKNGSPLDFLSFSTKDEQSGFIQVHFVHQELTESSLNLALEHPVAHIALADAKNHLAQAYQLEDTTFSPYLIALGPELLSFLKVPEKISEASASPNATGIHVASPFNLFTVPFIAGGDVIAAITLGFREMDSFSQAKLSYVYTLRDQMAQLIWNLILQDRMRRQSQVDNLTGLLSYTYFQSVLEREMAKSNHQDSSVTVMILDVNNIEEINQTMGHQLGDEAICHLASTVRRLSRGLDTVARYGGDEVVVVLPETDAKTADEIASRFLEGLKVRLPEALRHLSVSIGYATYPDDGKTREKLLKLAEQALHLAKFKGAKAGVSASIGCQQMDQLSDKTVIEVFASQVARKYDNIHVPSIYQELLSHIEKKTPCAQTKADDLMLETITSLAGALEAKDRYTRGHSQAVANYAVALAHHLKMTPSEVEEVRAAAFLHDIGKIGIPEDILCKDGPLNEKEWEIMKQHPVIGAQQILYPVASLRGIIPAVECHHENWDGTGHPHGHKGEKIPMGARIVSIVDAFHALTSDRPYRKAMPVTQAKQILEAGAGTKWDPYLLAEFFQILTIASPKPAETIHKLKEALVQESAGPGLILN